MKSEPTRERICEWIGVTDDHLQFIALGNPNPGYENLRLITFNNLLSFGNMLRVGNRYTMRFYCKKWNDIVSKVKFSGYERLFVHPERAEFALTIPSDRRRK